jgi:hypothetical protein
MQPCRILGRNILLHHVLPLRRDRQLGEQKAMQPKIDKPKTDQRNQSGHGQAGHGQSGGRSSGLGLLLIAIVSGLVVKVVGDPLVEVISPPIEYAAKDIREFIEDQRWDKAWNRQWKQWRRQLEDWQEDSAE